MNFQKSRKLWLNGRRKIRNCQEITKNFGEKNLRMKKPEGDMNH